MSAVNYYYQMKGVPLDEDRKEAKGGDKDKKPKAEKGGDKAAAEKPKKEKKEKAAAAPKEAAPKAAGGKKETKLGLDVEKTLETFPDWYSQVLTKSEMIDYYKVSGCYILRPWAYKVWELIQDFMNPVLADIGVENAYFPMFIPKSFLEREKDHIEGFAPEVAWVTKSGSSDLPEPIAIRPTSETVMYPSFADWIQSHRDLPLRLNQWCSVVRWEFKHPTPFIRTREFLWQEGHTAHYDPATGAAEVREILDLYARVYNELLAVPVIKGVKSEREKFAGGYYTTTVEAFIPVNGRGIQGATSHNLGQNFAKMFNIEVQDHEDPKKKRFIWQNSWGLSTRVIGVMVMVHGDNIGLVMPPRVAPVQVVIIPIAKTSNRAELDAVAEDIKAELVKVGVRCRTDVRDNYNPGWKFNHWEVKGVPIRMEIGPRDLEKRVVTISRRIDGEGVPKQEVPMSDLVNVIPDMLEEIQAAMLAKATAERDAQCSHCDTFDDMMQKLDSRHIVKAHWCNTTPCEEDIKERTANWKQEETEGDAEEAAKGLSGAAKTLCIPFDQDDFVPGKKCIGCGAPATKVVVFGRSY